MKINAKKELLEVLKREQLIVVYSDIRILDGTGRTFHPVLTKDFDVLDFEHDPKEGLFSGSIIYCMDATNPTLPVWLKKEYAHNCEYKENCEYWRINRIPEFFQRTVFGIKGNKSDIFKGSSKL
jgi:hypothetical protein